MAQRKAEQDNVDESLEHIEVKETKVESKNTRKKHVCNIYGIFFMYADKFVLSFHNHWTICNTQFSDLNSLIH